MAKIPNYTLNDGNQIPVLGFGTYKLNGATGVNAINSALNNGYSLLDSAFNYANSKHPGHSFLGSIQYNYPGRYSR